MSPTNHDKHPMKSLETRSRFDGFIEKAFWVMALAIGGYIGGQIKDMGKSVNELNQKVAIVIERQSELALWATKVDLINGNLNDRLIKLETINQKRSK